MMTKTTRSIAAIVALLATVLASAPAFAWHRHSGVRLGIGLNFGIPVGGYYPAPYYPAYYPYYPPYPPTVVYRAAPEPVYIEQGSEPAAPAQNYWYYCADARGYYPYVKECPGGWQRVSPQPRG
jgi:hypothetical protein